MVLHIGAERVVRVQHLLALIDAQSLATRDTAAFLASARKQGNVIDAQEPPKTIVLTQEGGETKVFLSPISTQTLLRRYEAILKLQENARRALR